MDATRPDRFNHSSLSKVIVFMLLLAAGACTMACGPPVDTSEEAIVPEEPLRVLHGRAIEGGTNEPLVGVRFGSDKYFQNPVATSGADGTFRLELPESAQAGSGVHVFFEGAPTGYVHDPEGGMLFYANAAYVLMDSQAEEVETDIYFRQGSIVRGRVFLQDGATPAPKVSVRTRISGINGPYWQWTDDDGKFALLVLPETEYELFAEGEAGVGLAEVVSPAPGGEEEVEIILADWALVSGRVTAAGQGMPNIQVGFWRASATSSPVNTDAEGRYQLRLEPGSAEVTVFVAPTQKFPFRRGNILSLTVESGVHYENQDLYLRGGRVFEGTVVDEQGAPLSDVTVARSIDEQHLTVTGTTEADGQFHVAGVDSNDVIRIRLSHPDYTSYLNEGLHVDDSPLMVTLSRKADAATTK